jgi:DNA-binding NtrC family response regulator
VSTGAQTAFRPHELIRPLVEVEKEAIESAMILCRGDVMLAASRLQISTRTLYRKLKQLMAMENDGVLNNQQ